MAYTQDKSGDIIIKGWEQGIADSPYDGISDIRNINLVSIPKEASVNFSTSANISPVITGGSVTSADAATFYLTYTGAANIENGMAINFSAQSTLGVTASAVTTYWILNKGVAGAGTFQITSDYAQTTTVHVTNGTGTFSVYNFGKSLAGGYSTATISSAYNPVDDKYYFLDAAGNVWSNTFLTTSGYWTFVGASGTSDIIFGVKGLAYYEASNGSRYLFVFRSQSIDYIDLVTFTWTWGWKPSTGETHKTAYLNKSTIYHEAFVAPDNVVYYCDGAYIGRFFEETGEIFIPTTTSTYITDSTRLLPFTDNAQCLSFLGTNLMIGGRQNVIYPWDTTSPTFSYPILLPEYNVQRMVTVNTTMFIFVGNRGRIYYTNGTNAQLYKKIPDHISGTVEPYFTWGGACSTKNQLYFSALATTNTGTALTAYGGLWAIDLDSKAIRLTNKLSYGTYAGYITSIIPNFSSNPAGTGLIMSWFNGSSIFGIDSTISTPYIAGEAYIDSDLIPIGSFLKATTNARVEFKLSIPLVSGETVSLWYRQKFSDSFVQIGSTITHTTNGSGTTYSYAYQNVPFQKSQWIQIRVVLTSASSSPSYCRLTELRLGS